MTVRYGPGPSGVVVTHGHVKACGLCMRGSRHWLRHKGGDWTMFLLYGIAVEWFDEVNDGICNPVAARARLEAEQRRGQ